jgi:hypothetical protein
MIVRGAGAIAFLIVMIVSGSVTVADHRPEEPIAAGEPERALSGIDLVSTSLSMCVRSLARRLSHMKSRTLTIRLAVVTQRTSGRSTVWF